MLRAHEPVPTAVSRPGVYKSWICAHGTTVANNPGKTPWGGLRPKGLG